MDVSIITTNTLSAVEMVDEAGIICENNKEGIMQAIQSLTKPKRIKKEGKIENKKQKMQFDVMFKA